MKDIVDLLQMAVFPDDSLVVTIFECCNNASVVDEDLRQNSSNLSS